MRYGFKIREEGQPILFTSNKEVIYPKIQSIAEKQHVIEGEHQRYAYLMGKLLDILEELEFLLSTTKLKHKYMLMNGDDLNLNNHFLLVVLKMIWRYSEPLDGESCVQLYQMLEEIEKTICAYYC